MPEVIFLIARKVDHLAGAPHLDAFLAVGSHDVIDKRPVRLVPQPSDSQAIWDG